MNKKVIAFAMSAALMLSPFLSACGGNQGSSNQSNSTSTETKEEVKKAPSLDGNWRQVGHAEGENGMIGTIDQDMIALWIKGDDSKFVYWCGSFEPPKDDGAYTWTSKADKGNMKGMLASQDDSKEFSYAGGKLSFKFTIQGETTTIEMEQASEESGLLAELRSGEGKSVDKEEASVKDLVLSDSCYNISNGYVQYTIAVENPNKEVAPKAVNVSVVGRSEDGSISFSDDWTISCVLPGATTYWTSQAGHGNVSDSDTVEIKLSVDDDNWYKTSEKYDFYQIDNVSTSEDSFGGTIVTGEITLKREVKLSGYNGAEQPMLVCVLKDADGKIVGGFNTYIRNELKVGEATPFEIDSHGQDNIDSATVEVYANPWM